MAHTSLHPPKTGDTWTELVSVGSTEARNGYYVANDVRAKILLFTYVRYFSWG